MKDWGRPFLKKKETSFSIQTEIKQLVSLLADCDPGLRPYKNTISQ